MENNTSSKTIELSLSDFDPDYEFDAPHFYDFSYTESQSDVDVAECWFHIASSYPPSPFLIKRRWNEGCIGTHSKATRVFEKMESSCSVSMVPNATGCLSAQDDPRNGLGSLKSGVKKVSTLMKPTASHLAKLNSRKEVSNSVRPQMRSVTNNEKSLQNSVNQNQATKRQKLESGYLLKVAHLNHQNVFAHKKTTEVAQLGKKSVDPKRVTVPREPMLETARRALIRSSRRKDTAEHARETESTTKIFKAHPLNKKILQNPSVPLRKRTTPVFPKSQELHLKTSGQFLQQPSKNAISMPESISISHTGSALSERSSYANTPTRQRNEAVPDLENDKEFFSSMRKNSSHIPPTELFSKLSLLSERQHESFPLKLRKATQDGNGGILHWIIIDECSGL